MNKPLDKNFVRYITEGLEFNFDDFKTKEELDSFMEETKRFNENPDSERYVDMLLNIAKK